MFEKKKLKQQSPPKTVMRQIWRVILNGGSPSLESFMTPLNDLFGKNVYMNDKINIFFVIQQKSFEFLPLDNSISAYLTEK